MLSLARKDSRARQRKQQQKEADVEEEGTQSGSSIKALTLIHMLGPLVLLFLGLLAAGLTFIMETLIMNRQNLTTLANKG